MKTGVATAKPFDARRDEVAMTGSRAPRGGGALLLAGAAPGGAL